MEKPLNYFDPSRPFTKEELARAVEDYFAADEEHTRTGRFSSLGRALNIKAQITAALKRNKT